MAPRWPTAVALTFVASALAGCFGGNKNVNEGCDDPAEYQASRDLPGIKAPEGLVPPSPATAYVVPPAPELQVRGAACLARPPAYFRPDTAPPPGAPAPAAPAPATSPAAPPET